MEQVKELRARIREHQSEITALRARITRAKEESARAKRIADWDKINNHTIARASLRLPDGNEGIMLVYQLPGEGTMFAADWVQPVPWCAFVRCSLAPIFKDIPPPMQDALRYLILSTLRVA
jgi:hypothetical protein